MKTPSTIIAALAAALVLTSAIALTGCGGSGDNTATTAGTTAATTATTAPKATAANGSDSNSNSDASQTQDDQQQSSDTQQGGEEKHGNVTREDAAQIALDNCAYGTVVTICDPAEYNGEDCWHVVVKGTVDSAYYECYVSSVNCYVVSSPEGDPHSYNDGAGNIVTDIG